MRLCSTVIAVLAFVIPSIAQIHREEVKVVRGELIKSIPSLKNLRQDPKLNPPVTRDLSGTIIKKTWKEQVIDYGTQASGDPVVQKEFIHHSPLQSSSGDEPLVGTRVLTNLDGMAFTNVSPADPCLTQGPNHLIQMINGSQGAYLQIWNKSGTVAVAQTYMYQLIATPGYSGNGDPIVMYDQFADRYILSEFGTSGGVTNYINTLIFAISATNDPTGGWNIYKFVDNSVFIDYPHYAVWPESIFGTSNDFNTAGTAYQGTSLMAFDKNKMYSGQQQVTMIRVMPAFFSATANPSSKPRSAAPVNISGNTPPAAGNTGLFLYYHDDNLTSTTTDVDSLGVISMTPDFANPSNTKISITDQLVVAPFKSNVCASRSCIPGGSGYDAISDRLMHRINYRNFGSYEALVANHTVDASYPASPARAGIRWYELRRSSGPWGVQQQGTYSPDGDGRWMGSININSAGQIALAFNSSGPGKFASIYFTGRNANDPAGLMVYDEGLIQQGTGYGTFSNRWGDYNDLTTDVLNDSIFWFTAMYGSTNWKTKVASIKLETLPALDAKLTSILSPANGLAQCNQTITPSITIRNAGSSTLNTLSIFTQLNDDPPGTPYVWSGSINIGGAANVTLPALNAKLGTNRLRIFIADPNKGSDENTLNDTLSTMFSILFPQASPLAEGFETSNFPVFGGWRVVNPNPGSVTWARTTNARKSGIASGFIDFYNYTQNLQEDYLLSPILDSRNADSIIISFDRAYRAYSTNSSYADGLAVVVSTDCGASFTEVWRKEGVDLATVGGTTTSAFVPSATEWINTRIDLKPYVGNATQIIAGFKTTNRFGNSLYLDDISLTTFRLPLRDALIRSVSEPNNRICTRSYVPQVILGNQGRDTLKTVVIYFQFGSYPTDSIKWSGAIPNGGSALIKLSDYNKVINFPSGGKYPYKFYTKDPNGLVDENQTNDINANVLTVFDPIADPVKEGFEGDAFPPLTWAVTSVNSTSSWQRTTQAANEKQASVFIKNFRTSTASKMDDLYGPLVRIESPDSVYLKFDVAHSTSKFPGSTGSPLDTLEVLLTTDCGSTFRSVYKKWGQNLVTTDKNFPVMYPAGDTTGFVPSSPAQWRSEWIDLTRMVPANSNFQVVFRNIGNKGNNTFLDKIEISTVTLPERLKKFGYMITPNPFENGFSVRHLVAPANLKGIQVTNLVGQTIIEKRYNGNAPNYIPLDMNRQANGIYQIKLFYDNQVITERIIKRK